MNAFLLEYLPIVIFLGIAAVLGLGFMLAAWVLAPKNPDSARSCRPMSAASTPSTTRA